MTVFANIKETCVYLNLVLFLRIMTKIVGLYNLLPRAHPGE